MCTSVLSSELLSIHLSKKFLTLYIPSKSHSLWNLIFSVSVTCFGFIYVQTSHHQCYCLLLEPRQVVTLQIILWNYICYHFICNHKIKKIISCQKCWSSSFKPNNIFLLLKLFLGDDKSITVTHQKDAYMRQPLPVSVHKICIWNLFCKIIHWLSYKSRNLLQIIWLLFSYRHKFFWLYRYEVTTVS